MNRPCRIHFHEDSAPVIELLPERYRDNLEHTTYQGVSRYSLLAQTAFYIDFAPNILRTRVSGMREDPIDFPLESVSHVEWFYGDDVPSPLTPYVDTRRN